MTDYARLSTQSANRITKHSTETGFFLTMYRVKECYLISRRFTVLRRNDNNKKSIYNNKEAKTYIAFFSE